MAERTLSQARDLGYQRSTAVRVGGIAGIAACIVYPLLLAVGASDALGAILAAAFGPLIGAACWGLREFVSLDRRRLTADIAAASNALAGALVTAMLMVQLAVKAKNDDPAEDLKAVWLGLDVAWDVYIGIGTVLFGLSAIRHPRLGRVIGFAGVAIGGALLALNLGSFPKPPADVGLVDLGPAIGLWYLVVAIVMLRSTAWARSREEEIERADA